MTKSYTILTDKSQIELSKWERILKNESTSFFQTPEALRFFETVGLETFVYAIESQEKITALITGAIHKEGKLTSLLTGRAIIYGGPVLSKDVEDKHILALLETLIKELKKEAIYIEIRNLNDYSSKKELFRKVGFQYQSHLNFHLDCSDPKEIKRRISSSKLRQIKKSIKEGAVIRKAVDEKDIEAYYAILKELYKTKVKTPLPDITFFKTLWNQNTAKFLLVDYKDEVIGGIICPVLKNKVIYEWYVCGKDRVHKNIYPSVLATWAAIEYASNNNIPRFDFMGAGKPDEDYGVREFKSKFGGEEVEHGRYLYVSKPILYKLGKTAVKILKST